jgi:hypothetical protein
MDRGTRRHWSVGDAEPLPATNPSSRRLTPEIHTEGGALRNPDGMQGPTRCAVRPVLRQAIEDHRALAEANGIGLSLHLPEAE